MRTGANETKKWDYHSFGKFSLSLSGGPFFNMAKTIWECFIYYKQMWQFLLEESTFFFFFLFRAPPSACEGSQTGDLIRATDAGLRHSHSNVRSLIHWARPGIEPATSWVLVRFVSAAPQWELHHELSTGGTSWVGWLFIYLDSWQYISSEWMSLKWMP